MLSELLKEEIAIGEKKLSDYASVNKEEIEDLKKSNEELLEKYSSLMMQNAVVQKLMKHANSKVENKKSNKYRNIKILSFAAAAVFALCFFPVTMKNINTTGTQSAIRTKGAVVDGPQIKIYKKAGDSIQILSDGYKAHENDQLQITYSSHGEKYGLIFSVDGNGNITNHLYSGKMSSVALETSNEEIPLEYSYVLDDAPDFECFVFVTSNKPFNLKNLKKENKSLKKLSYVKKGKYLPKSCKKTVFVIKK